MRCGVRTGVAEECMWYLGEAEEYVGDVTRSSELDDFSRN
jgi:hypothetical protein